MRHLRFLPAAILAGLVLAVFAALGSSHTAEGNDCSGPKDIAIGNVTDQMLSDAGLTADDQLEIEIRLFADGGIALVINKPDEPTFTFGMVRGSVDGSAGDWDWGGGPVFATFCSPAAEMHPLTDIDGDGVKNRDDDCPDTQPEVPVDANGCPLGPDT